MTNAKQIASTQIEDLLFEMDALNAVLRIIEGISDDRDKAISLVETALNRRTRSDDLSEILITAAMQKIVGTVSPQVIHSLPTDGLRLSVDAFEFFDRYLAADTTIQWLNYILDGAVSMIWPEEAEALPVESAIHEVTLRSWRGAIVRLAKDDLPESRRLFKRALEIGAQFGTESHVQVSWSYAATFFTEAR